MDTGKSPDTKFIQNPPELNVKQKRTAPIEEQKDWWDNISQEQQQAIDQSLTEMKASKVTSHEELIKKYMK